MAKHPEENKEADYLAFFHAKTDQELLDIYTNHMNDYTKNATSTIMAEITARGGIDMMKRQIDTQKQYIESEKKDWVSKNTKQCSVCGNISLGLFCLNIFICWNCLKRSKREMMIFCLSIFFVSLVLLLVPFLLKPLFYGDETPWFVSLLTLPAYLGITLGPIAFILLFLNADRFGNRLARKVLNRISKCGCTAYHTAAAFQELQSAKSSGHYAVVTTKCDNCGQALYSFCHPFEQNTMNDVINSTKCITQHKDLNRIIPDLITRATIAGIPASKIRILKNTFSNAQKLTIDGGKNLQGKSKEIVYGDDDLSERQKTTGSIGLSAIQSTHQNSVNDSFEIARITLPNIKIPEGSLTEESHSYIIIHEKLRLFIEDSLQPVASGESILKFFNEELNLPAPKNREIHFTDSHKLFKPLVSLSRMGSMSCETGVIASAKLGQGNNVLILWIHHEVMSTLIVCSRLAAGGFIGYFISERDIPHGFTKRLQNTFSKA